MTVTHLCDKGEGCRFLCWWGHGQLMVYDSLFCLQLTFTVTNFSCFSASFLQPNSTLSFWKQSKKIKISPSFFFFLNYCLFCTFVSNCSSEREVAAPVCLLGWRRFCLPDSQVGVAEVEGWVLCQWGSCVNPLGHSGLWRFCGLPRLLSVWTVVVALGILSVTVFKLIFPYAW